MKDPTIKVKVDIGIKNSPIMTILFYSDTHWNVVSSPNFSRKILDLILISNVIIVYQVQTKMD